MTRRTHRLLCAVVGSMVAGCGPSAKELHEAAVIEYQAHQIIKAKGLFEEALAKKPEQYRSSFYLGLCHKAVARGKFAEDDYGAAMRELDQAAFWFGQAIESYPGYIDAIRQKAEVLKMKGEYHKAMQLADWARVNTGNERGQLILLARQLADAGDYDGALVRLRQAVALDPHDSRARAELGRFLLQSGKMREGTEELQQAYRINPNEPGVLPALAELGYSPAAAQTVSGP